MKFYRIHALLLKYFYLMKRDLDRIFDIFYWPVVGLMIWGFTSVYLKDVTGSSKFISFLLGGLILWTFIQRAQQDISLSVLEDFWSRNIYNTYSSPVQTSELSISAIIFAGLRAFAAFAVLGIIAWVMYSFNIISFGVIGAILLTINLVIFGSSLGMMVAGMIYRFGMKIQVFAWSLAFLLQPFSAVFYPRSILPGVFHTISLCIPSSYVFEGMRQALSSSVVPWSELGTAFGLNLIYLFVGYFILKRFLDKSRQSGFLARNV